MRYLKRLVTTLTVTMIVGLVVLIALVVMRFNAPAATGFPNEIALPDGAEPQAITRGPDFVAVVTTAGEILVFDASGTVLRQRFALATEERTD